MCDNLFSSTRLSLAYNFMLGIFGRHRLSPYYQNFPSELKDSNHNSPTPSIILSYIAQPCPYCKQRDSEEWLGQHDSLFVRPLEDALIIMINFQYHLVHNFVQYGILWSWNVLSEVASKRSWTTECDAIVKITLTWPRASSASKFTLEASDLHYTIV